jgi:tetratricopeptide (TPR) repeat protein
VEGLYPLNDSPAMRAGTEMNFFKYVYLRGGYRARLSPVEGDVQSGPAFGGGLEFGILRLDYAFVPFGALSTTHRVAATMSFPPDLFGPKTIIQAEGGTATAKIHYDRGLDRMKSKDYLEAVLDFRRAQEYLEPRFVKVPLYALVKAKLAEANREMDKANKGGGDAKMRALINDTLDKAENYLKAGEFRLALREIRTVQKMDPSYTRTMRLVREAEGKMNDKLKVHMLAGAAATARNDLGTAVSSYRAVLRTDEDSDLGKEAGKKLEALRPRVNVEIKNIHRKGINLYLGGKVKDAVVVWKEGYKMGIEMDPANMDPDNLKRDIDKAEKLLELQKK